MSPKHFSPCVRSGDLGGQRVFGPGEKCTPKCICIYLDLWFMDVWVDNECLDLKYFPHWLHGWEVPSICLASICLFKLFKLLVWSIFPHTLQECWPFSSVSSIVFIVSSSSSLLGLVLTDVSATIKVLLWWRTPLRALGPQSVPLLAATATNLVSIG